MTDSKIVDREISTALRFSQHGLEFKRRFVSSSITEAIKNEVSVSNKRYSKHGIRRADQKFKTINALVNSNEFVKLAGSILGSTPNIVRVIFFDKVPDKNWLVTWHQDKTIALNKKASLTGWGPWSMKDGVHHVQPPLEVLNKMVTFRLHLDEANIENGCLNVIPKSHQRGILTQQEVTDTAKRHKSYSCEAKEGDLLIMRPHILHSSRKSAAPFHRRVVHVEYSNFRLPESLSWA